MANDPSNCRASRTTAGGIRIRPSAMSETRQSVGNSCSRLCAGAYCLRPHSGLVRLALLSTETPVTGLVLTSRSSSPRGPHERGRAHSQCHSPSDLAAGSLFSVDGKVFAGKGTGQLCTVCGTPIFATEVEHEVTEPQRAYAHMTCHSLWMQESKILGKSRE